MRACLYLFIALSLLSQEWIYAKRATDRVATGDIELDPQIEPDIRRKSQEIKRLTRNAAHHLLSTSIEKACTDFLYNPLWRKGELFVFVFDQNGVCLAHGDDTQLIWKNISDVQGTGGQPLIQEMLSLDGGEGAISYIWDNAYKAAYIKRIKKGKVTFIVGSGFFPESDEFTCKELIKTAAAYFNRNGKEATFALINNPKGPFTKGDIYMAAYNFDGLTMAHGQDAALVGQNRIDEVDSHGKPLIKELIRVARDKGTGWVEYYWRNEFKRGYVERVIDSKTKKPYLLTAGYYPNITLRGAVNYVKRAIEYLKAHGGKVAFAEFSNQVGKFVKGGLGIFVFDIDGKCVANGQNPSLVGQNLLKSTDQEGKYYVQDIISAARKFGSGFVTYFDYNSQAIAYVEFVEVPDGKFIVGTTYFPDSKVQSTQTLVNKAVRLIDSSRAAPEAFHLFSTRGSEFFRGDLSIFAYDTQGTAFANGIHTTQTWRNFLHGPRQVGGAIVRDIIAAATANHKWFEYIVRNGRRRVYLRKITAPLVDGEVRTFIVGSGYFM